MRAMPLVKIDERLREVSFSDLFKKKSKDIIPRDPKIEIKPIETRSSNEDYKKI